MTGNKEKEPTLRELMDSMTQMHNKMDSFKTEMTGLANKVQALEESNEKMDSRVSSLESKANNQSNVKEELERMKRASNLMLFGVPETEDGVALAENLLRLLLPSHVGPFLMRRQESKANASKRPGPLKVMLSNYEERRIALSNKTKLNGMDCYRGISVQPDRTKQQREDSKATGKKSSKKPNTRSQSRKRRNSDDEDAADGIGPGAKQPRKQD